MYRLHPISRAIWVMLTYSDVFAVTGYIYYSRFYVCFVTVIERVQLPLSNLQVFELTRLKGMRLLTARSGGRVSGTRSSDTPLCALLLPYDRRRFLRRYAINEGMTVARGSPSGRGMSIFDRGTVPG